MTPKEIIKDLKNLIANIRENNNNYYPLAIRYAIEYIIENEKKKGNKI